MTWRGGGFESSYYGPLHYSPVLLLVRPAAACGLRGRRIVHHHPWSNAHTHAGVVADTNSDSKPEPDANTQPIAHSEPDSHTDAGQP